MKLHPLAGAALLLAGAVLRAAPEQDTYTVQAGTRIPLALVNSISTKHSAEGDHVYLKSVYPVVLNGRIVIPAGSYVLGTVTQVKRPGRGKGRGELYLRFETLTLPNGVTRDFRARADQVEGQKIDRAEGKIEGEGNKAADARVIGETAAAGASVGAIAGAATHHPGTGMGVGAAAGAATGLAAVLLTRGPDVVLAPGTTVEMVLDRALRYSPDELSR